jgi:ABC-type nickel/cobalt efflux system permease component RcnA
VISDRVIRSADVAYRAQPRYLSAGEGGPRARSRMHGMDSWIMTGGDRGLMALVVAILLGLRHATDPDHLTAMSTLFLEENQRGPRRAMVLGFSWGLGHALTLFGFGLPIVLIGRYLPELVQRGAEAAIGILIAGLAVRLLLRWHWGYFHIHPHSHAWGRHAHPHVHQRSGDSGTHPEAHEHAHADALGRSPLAAFGIGLLHGIGGSAAAGVLLVGGATGHPGGGVLALLLFAGGTAISMTLLSTGFGYALARGSVRRRLTDLVPVLGAASLIFGVWYSLGALQGAV